MDNAEGLYWVTFEIGSMGYLRRNNSEQVDGMVAQGRDGKCSWWVAATSHGGKEESSRRPQGFFFVASFFYCIFFTHNKHDVIIYREIIAHAKNASTTFQ